MLHKRSSNIASFMVHSVCNNFKRYSVLILVFFYFDLPQLIQGAFVKVTFFGNFKCSALEALMLLRLWSTMYKTFSKYKVSRFQLFYFDLSLSTQSVCIEGIYFRNFRCPAKDAVILLPSWSTLYIAFLKCKVSRFQFFYFNLPPSKQSAYVKVNFS